MPDSQTLQTVPGGRQTPRGWNVSHPPLRISWRGEEAPRKLYPPQQTVLLLKQQLQRIEQEILSLPAGSPQADARRAAAEELLTEVFALVVDWMHPDGLADTLPSTVLSPAMDCQDLQSRYASCQPARQAMLREFLEHLQADLEAAPAAVEEPVALSAGGGIQWHGVQPAAAPTIRAARPAQAATQAAQCVDTFLFSDVHLGSDVSRSKELLEVLQSYSFKRLILLGDIFDDLNFKRLRRDHWEMLSWLRKLSDPDRNVEIVWILGNHDVLLENVSHFIGIDVCDKYAWEQQGKRFLAIHGHQFDRFLEENVVISEIATLLYLLVQKLDTRRQRFSRLLKRLSKKWLRLSNQVAVRAARYGRMQGADYVFCGHTHRAARLQLEGVSYFNTGCWTDIPSHFITVDAENRIELHEHE